MLIIKEIKKYVYGDMIFCKKFRNVENRTNNNNVVYAALEELKKYFYKVLYNLNLNFKWLVCTSFYVNHCSVSNVR